MEDGIAEHADGCVVSLRVVPRASRTGVVRSDDGYRIRVAAPPVQGAANKELVRYLAKLLGVARGDLVIEAGERGRRKRVLVRGMSAAEVRRRLGGA